MKNKKQKKIFVYFRLRNCDNCKRIYFKKNIPPLYFIDLSNLKVENKEFPIFKMEKIKLLNKILHINLNWVKLEKPKLVLKISSSNFRNFKYYYLEPKVIYGKETEFYQINREINIISDFSLKKYCGCKNIDFLKLEIFLQGKTKNQFFEKKLVKIPILLKNNILDRKITIFKLLLENFVKKISHNF